MNVYLCDGIKYRPVLDDDLSLYIVFIPYLDKEWRKGSKAYIPAGKGYDKKKESIEVLLQNDEPICPPEIFIAPDGLMVVDGRHRLSVVRDKGKKEMVVSSKSDLSVYKWVKKIAP